MVTALTSSTGARARAIASGDGFERRARPCDTPQWFAIWTRSRHEQVACRELATHSIEAFLPTVSKISRWKDRRKTIHWPLFPGYCFGRFDAASLPTVLKCEGVVTVLSNGHRPLAIPDQQIQALQRLMASGLAFDPCSQFSEGATVRVVSGPLAGIVGCVERRATDAHLVLAIELLNGGARVQVAASDLEPC